MYGIPNRTRTTREGLVSRKSRKPIGPGKPFAKLRPAYSVKLVFSYVVKGIKNKITTKFRASRRLRFEDKKKSFGTFERRALIASLCNFSRSFVPKVRMRPGRCFVLEANTTAYHVDKKMRTIFNIPRNWCNDHVDGNIASRKKGICHIWSRGRHFSPSLPVALVLHGYLKASVQSDLRAEISGSIVKVQRSGASSRGTTAGSCFLIIHCFLFIYSFIYLVIYLSDHCLKHWLNERELITHQRKKTSKKHTQWEFSYNLPSN